MNAALTQTWALLVDAYRELNSKKLFWISLAISGLIVAAFALIGVTPTGIKFVVWDIDLPFMQALDLKPERFYKLLFTNFGLGFWLAWLGTILALVSTAGLIPDFIASGAVELTLSKPVSRIRLFLTKFACGLLFVTLQVTVFTAASFLVIGIKGGVWEPGLFLAVPIVVIFFSYLFSICALLGLLTRSTIASLLLTLLVWLFLFALNAADIGILQGQAFNAVRQESLEARITRMEKATTEQVMRMRQADAEAAGQPRESAPTTPPTPEEMDRANPRLTETRQTLEEVRENGPKWERAASIVVTAKTVFPKTSETIALLERWLVEAAELETFPGTDDSDTVPQFGGPLSPAEQRALEARVENALRGRTVAWVLGTSLAFEAIILALACFIFARRDF